MNDQRRPARNAAADNTTASESSRLTERLELPDAVLSSTDLRALGYPRRAIDQIWRNVATVNIDGYSRPLVRVADLKHYLAQCADQTVVR